MGFSSWKFGPHSTYHYRWSFYESSTSTFRWVSLNGAKVRSGHGGHRCRSKTLEQLASHRCLGAKNNGRTEVVSCAGSNGGGKVENIIFPQKIDLRWVFMKMGLFFCKMNIRSRWMLDWTKCPGCYWNVPETKSITNLWKMFCIHKVLYVTFIIHPCWPSD